VGLGVKRISSGQAYLLKWFLPLVFLLAAVLGPVMAWLTHPDHVPPGIVIAPLLMLAIGYFVMRNLVWDLADQVLDGGDYLVVKKGRIEERVPLSNIMNVSATTLVNPPRIELRLAEPNRLGERIVFSPARNRSLNPFARNAIAEDLIVRVDRARANRKR
jgi:hypothetical protein